LGKWAEERGIELKFIQPGIACQNAYAEGFSKSCREEVPDSHFFKTRKGANVLSQAWAWIYNIEGPQMSLGY